VPDRVANIIILVEDQEHQNLVRRYLQRTRHSHRSFRLVRLPGNRQCGSQHVREQFPKQLAECRGMLGRRTRCMLIVVTDADNLTTAEREQTLHTELSRSGCTSIVPTEPVIILIPKWQVETWIKCLLGQAVAEDDRDTDRPPVTPQQIDAAAGVLYQWTRPKAQVGATCVQSLQDAIPRWRRIG